MWKKKKGIPFKNWVLDISGSFGSESLTLMHEEDAKNYFENRNLFMKDCYEQFKQQ